MEAYLNPALMKCPKRDPNRCFTTSDIYQKPKPLLNKPNFAFDVSDIEGAQPKPERSHLGNRKTNPLNPEYEWSYPSVPGVPESDKAKFVRCTMNVSDIWGAQPSKCMTYHCKTRDSLNFKDIKRSFAGWQAKEDLRNPIKKVVRNSLNVHDINSDKMGTNHLRGNRCTNPLQPEYEYDHRRRSGLKESTTTGTGRHPRKNIVGPVSGSTANIMNPYIHKSDFVLRTDDIQGAKVNTQKWKVRYPRDPNHIADIERCKTNTIIKFKTKRCTNPLNPKYNFLDYRRRALNRTKSTPALTKKKNTNAQSNRTHINNDPNSKPKPKPNHAEAQAPQPQPQPQPQPRRSVTEAENESQAESHGHARRSHSGSHSGSHRHSRAQHLIVDTHHAHEDEKQREDEVGHENSHHSRVGNNNTKNTNTNRTPSIRSASSSSYSQSQQRPKQGGNSTKQKNKKSVLTSAALRTIRNSDSVHHNNNNNNSIHNHLSKYERKQQRQQRNDDIESVRSLQF